jgi:hypothetical protein
MASATSTGIFLRQQIDMEGIDRAFVLVVCTVWVKRLGKVSISDGEGGTGDTFTMELLLE